MDAGQEYGQETADYLTDAARDELRAWLLRHNADPREYNMDPWCDVWWEIQRMVCGERYLGDLDMDTDGEWLAYRESIPIDHAIEDPVTLDWMLLLLERLTHDEIMTLHGVVPGL